jgi:tryptophan synthase alpha chain
VSINQYFRARRLKTGERKAFIPYFTLGDPTPGASLALIKSAIDGGADALELGFPFSDPVADGPVIQRSTRRALQAGMTTDRCFELIEKIREYSRAPIGLLLYYNLIHAYGLEPFMKRAKGAGVQAVLAADLPLEESIPFQRTLEREQLESVFMTALNTSENKLKRIIGATTGYLYLVAVLGVTGERSKVSKRCIGMIKRIGKISDIPLCVGFGISTPAHAGSFEKTGVDGFIVGSAIARLIEEHEKNPEAACIAIYKLVKSFTGKA